jgi:hypothetical protein
MVHVAAVPPREIEIAEAAACLLARVDLAEARGDEVLRAEPEMRLELRVDVLADLPPGHPREAEGTASTGDARHSPAASAESG